jgi:hypothetical protein
MRLSSTTDSPRASSVTARFSRCVYRASVCSAVAAFPEPGRGGCGGIEARELLADAVRREQHRSTLVSQSAREDGLAGSGKATDERQQRVPNRGLGIGVRTGLVVGQACHLRAQESAVGDVVVVQGSGCGITGELGVGVEEGRAQLGVAEPFQVHREERDVVQGVDVPQMVVEVGAVEHARAVGEAENVIGDQVAVSVHEPCRHRSDVVDEAVGQQCTLVVAELVDVGPPTPAQGLRSAVDGDARPANRAGVEGGHQPGQVAQGVLYRSAREHEGRAAGTPRYTCGAATTVAPQDQSPRRPPNPEQVDPSSRTGTAQTSA